MVHFSVGTCWDDSLLPELARLNQEYGDNARVVEVYGSLPTDPVGSVREAWRLPQVSMEDVDRHCSLAAELGLRVNYTINSTTVSAHLLRSNGKEVMQFLDRLLAAGIWGFTLASPLLIQFIRRSHPRVPVCVSTAAEVRSVAQARYFEDLGVARIKLSVMCNRDFDLLDRLASAISCHVELLVNEACLLFCPLRSEHFNMESLARDPKAPPGDEAGCQAPDYPYDECSRRLLSSESFPAEIIKAPWIRPEDVVLYEKGGVNYFKITGRTMPAKWIALTTERYISRKHVGNLLDLFPLVVSSLQNERKPIRYPHIDNAALGGFLPYFLRERPRCHACCGTRCTYCYAVAKRLQLSGAVTGALAAGNLGCSPTVRHASVDEDRGG